MAYLAAGGAHEQIGAFDSRLGRATGTLTFPANFVLVGAMNPCPCGFYGDPVKECTCSLGLVSRYQKRISGPLLDRIDIHVEVPRNVERSNVPRFNAVGRRCGSSR